MGLNKSSITPNNSSAKPLLLLLLMFFWLPAVANGQFFTKTSKSVPRLGRRGDPSMQALHVMVTDDATPMGDFFRKYDTNGDWCLSPEELWQMPLFRMAVMSRGPVAHASQAATGEDLNRRSEEREDSFRGILSTLNEK